MENHSLIKIDVWPDGHRHLVCSSCSHEAYLCFDPYSRIVLDQGDPNAKHSYAEVPSIEQLLEWFREWAPDLLLGLENAIQAEEPLLSFGIIDMKADDGLDVWRDGGDE